MRIEQLQYLIMLKKEKSINAAAEKSYISPQALGKAIRSMEKELGIELLEHSAAGSILTEKGKKFVDFAEKTIYEYNKLLSDFREDEEKGKRIKGELIIYSSFVYGVSILPIVISDFQKDFPNIKIINEHYSINKIIEKVNAAPSQKEVIGLLSIPLSEREAILKTIKEHNLKFVKIRNTELGFYCSKDSELAKSSRISINTLRKKPFIRFMNHDENWEIFSGKKQNVAMLTTSYSIWLNAIIQDTGIGVLCDIALENGTPFSYDVNRVYKIETREKIIYELGYITRKEHTEIIDEFSKYMMQYEKNI